MLKVSNTFQLFQPVGNKAITSQKGLELCERAFGPFQLSFFM